MTEDDLASRLVAARSGGALPPSPGLSETAQAYRVQALTLSALGAVGGWKVGAPSPSGPITCAPLPADTVLEAPHSFDATVFTQREVESEICFRLATDLPSRVAPYCAAEVLDAIESCHPGIEVLQCRFADAERASPIDLLADLIQSGAYVVGEPIAGWRDIDFSLTRVVQTSSGGGAGEAPSVVTREAQGNPAGDMARLLVWMANEGARWAGGLRRGQIVTCGSWTGKAAVPAHGEAVARFDCAAPVLVRFRV